MSYEKIERPKADKKKIHSKNEFELCYLRHQYLRRSDFNPTDADMRPYYPIAEKVARSTYYVYNNLLQMVGMNVEDLININKVHLVSFLSLFVLDKLPHKKQEFIEIFQNRNQEDPELKNFIDKNKANFTMFLKQRMEDLVRVCRQKARNIKGLSAEEFNIYCGEKKPPTRHYALVKDPHRYGYKKIDIAVFKSIKKKAKIHHEATVFFFNNLWYVAVPVARKSLTILDFDGAGLNPHNNFHHLEPDTILENAQESKEEEFTWNHRQIMFHRRSKTQKIKLLRKWIAKNKKNRQYKEEVQIARNLIRSLVG